MSTHVSAPPRTGYPFLDSVIGPPRSVIAMAHRGGATHPEIVGLENTMAAFEHAVALGYSYLETDVHVSNDGVLLAFHDDVLDRVTDLKGAVAALTHAEIGTARIAESHGIPRLSELLDAFPHARFNIDIKSAGAVQPLADLILASGAPERFCVGSFSLSRINEFRARTGGQVATSASPPEVIAFLTARSGGVARWLTRGRVAALQVPRQHGRIPVVTRSLVRRAHAAGAHVHVWTIDDPDEIRQLLDIGVDGIITDRTDLLKDVLIERGQWTSWEDTE